MTTGPTAEELSRWRPNLRAVPLLPFAVRPAIGAAAAAVTCVVGRAFGVLLSG